MWRKLAISVFIAANLLTAVYMNKPVVFTMWLNEALTSRYSRDWLQPISKADLAIRHYAHFSGQDTRWQMFYLLYRVNWRYEINAVYTKGDANKTVLLPLPKQSRRTPLQYWFFDYREKKFLHITHVHPELGGIESYARYLSRQFPTHEGMPLKSIVVDLYTRDILDPWDAVAQGTHVAPTVGRSVKYEYHLPANAD